MTSPYQHEPGLQLHRTSDGIVHWKYAMRGVLLVCGSTAHETSTPQEAPTCLMCISMVFQDKHIVQPPF